MGKAIMLCLSAETVQEWIRYCKSSREFAFSRKNFPNVEYGTKIYLYCPKAGLVTTTDEHGNEIVVRGTAIGQDGKFYNGRVFGECVYNGYEFNELYENFAWYTSNNIAYDKPKPIWNFTQYGKDKPMYRAISDWSYVEEIGYD